ncbi:flagellar hook-basal body complex protein FliE [Pelomonas sp. KK5]|uniref:flagellar hook-basal body complex protein FliE n=1 Tax=Pelomonas sp. KK5 TaxID=1855730 RepID=UPI00097C9823|nr:flagellar hook-basal body complex protein FliE [Pelomonas sp. KK5]
MNIQANPSSGAIQLSLKQLEGDLAGLQAQLGTAAAPAQGGFAQSMEQVLQRVDGKEHDAADRMADVDSGRSDDLVGAMLASQDASLSFSMLMQVRNKVMGAMDELLKLQL